MLKTYSVLSCLPVIMLCLALSGCNQPAEVDGAQLQATHGSMIDLVELRRLTDPEFPKRAEFSRRTLSGSDRILRSFTFQKPEEFQGWRPAKDTPEGELVNGALRTNAPDGYFAISLKPDFDCSRAQRVHIRMRRLKGVPGGAIRMQWINIAGESFTGDRSLTCPLRREDWYHIYTIEVGNHPDWQGEKALLRLEFLNIEQGVEIDAITFEEGLTREEEAMLRIEGGFGGAILAIHGETRPATRTIPGEPCSVSVSLPDANCSGSIAGSGLVLRFAVGISRQGWIHGGNPVRFRIIAESDRSQRRDPIFDFILDPVRNGEDRSWHAHDISLDSYAGERVRLTFSTENIENCDSGGTGAFAVWAHPIIHCPAPPLTNILVILVDTLRADHLSCYGYPNRTTPHLDHLAGKGVLFEELVSSSCWTAPAVASLFTGQHPYRHGVRSKHSLNLGEGADTLAEMFRREGYFTGAISDNMLIIPNNGYAQGFLTFLTHPWSRQERGARELTDLAISWLERNGDRPFFFYLHYMDPHSPYFPEPPFNPEPPLMPGTIRDFVKKGICGEVTKRIRNDADFRLSDREKKRLLDLYDGEIASTDFNIGRLLAWLDHNGLTKRTAVAILADHGEGFGEHGVYSHSHTLHDEEIRIPLFILPSPGIQISPGARHPGTVRMVDVAPTILALSGQIVTENMVGRSLMPVIEKNEQIIESLDAYSERAPSFRPNAALRVESSIRMQNLKLISSPGQDEYRMFNLVDDPCEQEDIFDSDDPMTIKMMSMLDRYFAKAVESSNGAAQGSQDLNAVQLRQLEALGYLDQ